MFKAIILFLILASIPTKQLNTPTTLGFDTETSFDKEKYEFVFTNEDLVKNFYLVKISTSSILTYECVCTGAATKKDKTTVYKYFILHSETGQCVITITTSSEVAHPVKGTIQVHPLKNSIQTDITKNTYKISNILKSDESTPPIVYSVSNLENDIEIKLSYSSTSSITRDGKVYSLSNPYEVCMGTDCKTGVTSYTFLKGNNYEIHAKFEEILNNYYMAPFSFGNNAGSTCHLSMTMALIYIILYILCL